MTSSTMASMDGPMPIQTYILRRDQYHKSYPPLLEHPYDYKVHAAQPALVYIHSVIASSQLVEKELYALNLKFLECHCFTRHSPDIKPQYRYPVISISATGHPDHFTSAVKVIWRKLANCRKDEFMQKLVVEIYDRALMTSRERFEISESVAVEAGLSPLPAGLQRFRKQLNAWVQFTPCLMYAHCSASTEDNKPIPTLLVRCLHNKTAEFAKLEDDIQRLLPKAQIIFKAIPPLPNDEAEARSAKQIANRLDSDLWALRQKRHHSFFTYLVNMFKHPSFPALTATQQSSHILEKSNDRYHHYITSHTPHIPGLPPPNLESIIYLATELDAKLKHPGESESMSYALFFADTRRQLNQMVVRANALAAAEKEKPKLPEPVELGLDYGEEMTWLEYYTRFRTPGVEMRYAQRMHRLEKSAAAAAAAAAASTSSTTSITEAEAEIWHPYHPRTHLPPTLPSRQSAIPSHCTILGSLDLPFPIDLRAVFEQEEEDQWSTIDATEAVGKEDEDGQRSALDEVVGYVRGSVWFDNACNAAGRVALGKEWRKWRR
ncbi:hypothetical protein D6D21_02074 [Aureobasidium pullulans]|uniref:Uncharacterized protein n=1 Tax=Aureobasidium pullulans TaxID=5580 RepID=A0AB74J7F4_AURPU|nr:hypothetical protein D6D21_02074 [Aureobasidium pullulans]